MMTAGMNLRLALLLSLLAPLGQAANVGDTYAQVIAEQGPPVGQMTAGTSLVLTYPNARIYLRQGVVVTVKPAPPAPASVVAPAESEKTEPDRPPPPPKPAAGPGQTVDHPTYLAYLPAGWTPEKPHPLVFALSPTGNPRSRIAAWSSVADRHRWLIAASKEFRNGLQFEPSLRQIEAELDAVERDYAVDLQRVIFTGISGGGMGAHAFAKFHPDRLRALVINTGMMAVQFQADPYPDGMLAVFLASPTDFRYAEMKRDRGFLERHQWRVKWIEFTGGHTLAPAPVYEQAAAWLEDNLPSPAGSGRR
jgi:predicted esterase